MYGDQYSTGHIPFSKPSMLSYNYLLIDNQLVASPVFEGAVGQVPSNHQRNLLLLQLLHGDLQRVRGVLNVHENGRVHGDLQCSCTQHSGPLVLGHVWGGSSLFSRDGQFSDRLSSHSLFKVLHALSVDDLTSVLGHVRLHLLAVLLHIRNVLLKLLLVGVFKVVVESVLVWALGAGPCCGRNRTTRVTCSSP